MSLLGVKKGKRKRKSAGATTQICDVESNKNAAEELRKLLLQPASKSVPNSSVDDRIKDISKVGRRAQGNNNIRVGWEKDDEQEKNIIIMDTSVPQLERQDLRHGGRKGKKSKHHQQEQKAVDDKNKTIQDMVKEESLNKNTMDNVFANNILRLGSRYKGKELKSGDKAGADEEEEDMDVSLYNETAKNRLTSVAVYQREKSRHLATHKIQQNISSKCWWWMSSSSFQKHLLLSLGDHLSLVLTPPNIALVPNQCYLVPLKHADSFVACDEEVWHELRRFRRSLRQMFQGNGGVLFCETFLQTKHGFWQARMNVIPVPKHVEEDAPIYFKSALTEQAQEWGTHTKIIPLSKQKPLYRAVPKGFAYFSIEWDDGDGGYAQVIEKASHEFPKNFGLDIIASMMQKDPIRFNHRGKKKKSSIADEKKSVLDFIEYWKPFDWTVELDDVKS